MYHGYPGSCSAIASVSANAQTSFFSDFYFGANMDKSMLRGRSAGGYIIQYDISRTWSGVILTNPYAPHACAAQLLPLDSPRDNNQWRTAKYNLAAHAVAGIQTHYPLIRGNLCLRTATTSWTTESLQPTYPCCDGDSNPQPLLKGNRYTHYPTNLSQVFGKP